MKARELYKVGIWCEWDMLWAVRLRIVDWTMASGFTKASSRRQLTHPDCDEVTPPSEARQIFIGINSTVFGKSFWRHRVFVAQSPNLLCISSELFLELRVSFYYSPQTVLTRWPLQRCLLVLWLKLTPAAFSHSSFYRVVRTITQTALRLQAWLSD